MKNLIVIVALVCWAAASAADDVPTDDDWGWLGENAWRAIDVLMPLEDPARPTATFRASRLVQYDFSESYFQLSEGYAGHPLTAHLSQ